MHARFMLKVAASVALLNVILFLVLLLCFDDHFQGDPPPGATELAISYILRLSAFPLLLVIRFLGHDLPYAFFSYGVMFILSGFVWAVVIERSRYFLRRSASRPLSS
jgi:hypothetical protein